MSVADEFAGIVAAQAEDLPSLNRIMFTSRAYSGEYKRILEGYDLTPLYLAGHFVRMDSLAGLPRAFYSLAMEPTPELDLLFTANEFHSLGIGSRLFRHMAELARSKGAKQVRIVAHPPAEGFYISQGAIRVGEVPPGKRATWARPLLVLPLG